MEIQWKQFLLGKVCLAVSSKGSLIKGKQIQKYSMGLYPAYSATGQDIWREEYEHEGEAIIVSAVGARCGKCFRADGKWTAVANTHIIFPKENIDRNFLFYQVNNENFWEKGGVAQPFIKMKDSLRRRLVAFPVDKNGNPNLAEQKRIVTILEEAEVLKMKRAEADQKMDTLVSEIFIKMFTASLKDTVKLGDYIDFLTSGSRGWAKYYSKESGSKFIRIQNVKNAKLNFSDVQFVSPPDTAEAKRTKVKSGDLLISITADLGRTAVVDQETAAQGAYINQHLALVRLDGQFNPLFVAYFLETKFGKNQFLKYGQAAAKKGLNFDSIKSLKVPKPPIILQNRLAEIVKEIEVQKQKQKQSAEKIDKIFQSLLSLHLSR